MSREFVLPAIFTVMVIGMTIFPDSNKVFGSDERPANEITALASAS